MVCARTGLPGINMLCNFDLQLLSPRGSTSDYLSRSVHEKGFLAGILIIYDRLVGLVVKAPAPGAKDLGFESRLHQDFSGSSHASDLKIGTPVATLPGAWRHRVSTGTGRPGVSIL